MSISENTAKAETVVDLAEHMQRLRGEAESLQASFDTKKRGYFTPSEDDPVQHLWISYHKSRRALWELIDTVRRDAGKANEDNLVEFAIAYSAALVLVDAARSLRDLFADNHLVRRKLNESYELYGIDSGSFDEIQMSLTEPANAVRIKNAHDFFDEHETLIRLSLSERPELRSVMDVIDRLHERAGVSSRRYLKARARDRGHDVKAVVSEGVSAAIYAIQELGSRLVSNITTIPNHVPRLPEAITRQLSQLLRPGDVFVTRKDNALTNYFLPGFWPHAALYIGGQRVIESLKDGVRERSMASPFGNDAVVVIRPSVDEGVIEKVIERARAHVGKPYDFDFDFTRADRLVCTEVVYRSFEGIGGLAFRLTRRAGRETLSAEDLLALAMDHMHFEPVALYCAQYSDQLLSGPELMEVLRETVVR